MYWRGQKAGKMVIKWEPHHFIKFEANTFNVTIVVLMCMLQPCAYCISGWKTTVLCAFCERIKYFCRSGLVWIIFLFHESRLTGIVDWQESSMSHESNLVRPSSVGFSFQLLESPKYLRLGIEYLLILYSFRDSTVTRYISLLMIMTSNKYWHKDSVGHCSYILFDVVNMYNREQRCLRDVQKVIATPPLSLLPRLAHKLTKTTKTHRGWPFNAPSW